MKRILLIEDEPQLQRVIKLNLEYEGYEVVSIDHGLDAIKLNASQRFDLLILDVMLPGLDGLKVCEQVRLTHPAIAIIMISAKDTSEDRIKGLTKGADDYLVKPFHLDELLLRVQKLIQRTSSQEEKSEMKQYQFGQNKIDFSRHEAHCSKGTIMLTKKEALLLKLFIDRKEEVISRNEILQSVWGYDIFPSTRTIDNFILSFRKYFETDPKSPKHFISVRGIGYKFEE